MLCSIYAHLILIPNLAYGEDRPSNHLWQKSRTQTGDFIEIWVLMLKISLQKIKKKSLKSLFHNVDGSKKANYHP